MTENNEVSNKFEDEPRPEAVAAAVREALPDFETSATDPRVQQIPLLPCPCGSTEANLMLDVPQGQKVGRATCSLCGVWGVDFLVPRSQDQNLIGAAASKAWNEAPRG